jgi:uncharacterized membrane protein
MAVWPLFGRRPLLLGALAAGLISGIASSLIGVRPTTAVLIGWDVSAAVYVITIIGALWSDTPEELAQRAAKLDEGKWTILLFCATAAVASLVAVVVDLTAAKGTPQAPGAAMLAGGTVVISWIFVQVLFAHHYAFEHWLHGKGLDFPGNDKPDFPEFLYFSMTVGMAAEVADATTRSAAMRRLVLGHAVLSFLFNAVVLATAVNLAAALVG